MEIIIMDYSIEALIAEGTGLKTRDEMKYTSSSESAYDGYFDAVQAELTRSFENLEFLDTYSRVNEANDASKLRMMKRLEKLRVIVQALLSALPSVGWVVVLLLMIYYIFAEIGANLFSTLSPEYFGTLWRALYTLF
jgi:hypothetical protein